MLTKTATLLLLIASVSSDTTNDSGGSLIPAQLQCLGAVSQFARFCKGSTSEPRKIKVSCKSTSQDNGRSECPVFIPPYHKLGEVRIAKESSASLCELDKTYGSTDGGLWVSGGCEGVFTVSMAVDLIECDNGGKKLAEQGCSAWVNDYNVCSADIMRNCATAVNPFPTRIRPPPQPRTPARAIPPSTEAPQEPGKPGTHPHEGEKGKHGGSPDHPKRKERPPRQLPVAPVVPKAPSAGAPATPEAPATPAAPGTAPAQPTTEPSGSETNPNGPHRRMEGDRHDLTKTRQNFAVKETSNKPSVVQPSIGQLEVGTVLQQCLVQTQNKIGNECMQTGMMKTLLSNSAFASADKMTSQAGTGVGASQPPASKAALLDNPEPEPEPPRKRNPVLVIIMGIFLFVSIGAGCGYWIWQRGQLKAQRGTIAPKYGRWSSGLYACDWASCLPSTLCPCFQAALTQAEVHDRDSSLVDVCLNLTVHTLATNTYCTRQAIREKYGISPAPVTDCLVSICCTPCAIAQHTREQRKRNAQGYQVADEMEELSIDNGSRCRPPMGEVMGDAMQ